MSIPQNGKVIIIDDRLEDEALPLLLALSQEGISFSCYNGRLNELPLSPIIGTRLLFLDLKLEGIPGTFDINDIISSIKPVVEKLISPDNGPYVIFGWTDTPSQLKYVIDSLIFKPITFISMDKSECLASSSPIKIIKQKLHKKIASLGAIGLIFQWENLTNKSAYLTTNSILDIVANENELSSILYKISEAYLGQHIKKAKPVEKKRALFHSLNNLLLDTAKKNISINNLRKYTDIILDQDPSEEQLAKLDAKFLINPSPSKMIIPGNVYLSSNRTVNTICKNILDQKIDLNKIKKAVKRELSETVNNWSRLNQNDRDQAVTLKLVKRIPAINKEFKKIFLEITPVCDFSQNNFNVHRVVTGLLFPARLNIFFKEEKIEGAFYISNKFYLEKYHESYQFIIYFRGFLTLSKKLIQNGTPILSINQELLFDIQHRVGNHLSRPGVSTVA